MVIIKGTPLIKDYRRMVTSVSVDLKNKVFEPGTVVCTSTTCGSIDTISGNTKVTVVNGIPVIGTYKGPRGSNTASTTGKLNVIRNFRVPRNVLQVPVTIQVV